MLEIFFLGTGSGIPTRERNHAAIWLHYGKENMLWDCGEGTQRQMLFSGINPMKIDNVFISHWHADHWAGLVGFMQTMNFEGRKKPLYVHGPEAEKFVSDILDLGYWGHGFEVIPEPVQFEKDEETIVYETKDFVVTSIPVKHSIPSVSYAFHERESWNVDIKKAEEKYGIKEGRLVGELKRKGEITKNGKKITLKDVGSIKKGIKVVYSGDTMPCDNFSAISKDSDLLIADATFIENMQDRMHCTIKDCIKTAKEGKVKTLALTHFSRRYSDPEELEKEADKYRKDLDIIVAKDMMKLSFTKKGMKVSQVPIKK